MYQKMCSFHVESGQKSEIAHRVTREVPNLNNSNIKKEGYFDTAKDSSGVQRFPSINYLLNHYCEILRMEQCHF